MRGRGVMLVAGTRMGEKKGEQQAQAQMQAQQQQQAQQKTQAPSTAPAPTKDVTAELQKLSELHNSGALTEQEFADAKKKLLT